MESLLTGLVWDLREKCKAIWQILQSNNAKVEIKDYVDWISDKTTYILQGIDDLLNQPDFCDPKVLKHQCFIYSRLYHGLSQVEWFALPAISRYNDGDHYLNFLCSSLAQQVAYPLPAPLASGFSEGNYGTYPLYRLIKVPAAEPSFLLGLPALCHELGHILITFHESDYRHIIKDFSTTLSSYIDTKKQEPGTSPKVLASYDGLKIEWKDRWAVEFTCDVIGTFMIGPAFGYSHLRLCILDRDVFRPGFGESNNKHPSPESRIRAILAMLKMTGFPQESTVIHDRWLKYLSMTATKSPADYDCCYPDTLIDSLVQRVHDWCVRIGLTPYKHQQATTNDGNLTLLVNEAWTLLLTNPKDYGKWELQKVKNLRSLSRA